MVPALEAVADGIMHFEGWIPGSRSYRNRNPGNLESGPGVYREFPSLVDGYQALLEELRSKFSGENQHGIGPDSTLLQLFNVYAPPSDNNPTNKYCSFVADYASHALGCSITPETRLRDIWQETGS